MAPTIPVRTAPCMFLQYHWEKIKNGKNPTLNALHRQSDQVWKKYIMLLSVGLLLDKDGELREDDG